MKLVMIRKMLFVLTLASASTYLGPVAFATNSIWLETGAGTFSWADPTKWDTNPNVPNAAADIANFTTAGVPAAQTVNLNGAVTLGSLNLTNTAISYTIANGTGGSFNFNNSGIQAKITSNSGSLSQTVDANITIGDTGLTVEQFGANTLTLNGPIDTSFFPLTVNSGIASGTAGNVVINGVISGSGPFAKHSNLAVPGNVTLTAANTYSGDTYFGAAGTGYSVITAPAVPLGTITLSGGNDRLPAGSVLNLFPQNFVEGSSYNGALDIGSTSQTLSTIKLPGASLTKFDAQATGSVFSINGVGGTLTLNGDDLIVGITHKSGGTLVNGNGGHRHNLNMNLLSNFVFNNPSKSIVIHNSGRNAPSATYLMGILSIGNTSVVNAASVLVGDLGANGSFGGGRSDLSLGLTSTALNVGSDAMNGVISIGYSGRSTGNLTLPAGASVTIRGFGGGNTPLPEFLVGLAQASSVDAYTSTVNFASGTTNAIITKLDLSTANNSGARAGVNNGVFNLGATSGPEGLTVGTLNLGIIKQTADPLNPMSPIAPLVQNLSAAGTFTLNHADGVLNATTINFCTNTILDTAFARTVTGTLNLTNGTIRATTIQLGSQIGVDNVTGLPAAGTATPVKNFNWTTGTLENTAGANLSISSIPITLLTTASHTFNATGSNSITQAANAPISGLTFGITKTGTGSLVYNAANTYTGTTTVNDGTLTASGAAATLGAGNVTVNAGSAAISAGVTNALADTAILTLLGGGTAGIADTGFIDLGAGINETINMLVLGATTQVMGTYGSSLSSATFKLNEYFSGTGILTVTSGLPGDYNGDGKVNAADYVVWRKNPGGFPPNAYDTWRANFGNPPGSGASLDAGAVPEPGTMLLLLSMMACFVSSRRCFSRIQRS